jgi:hypothetical protein
MFFLLVHACRVRTNRSSRPVLVPVDKDQVATLHLDFFFSISSTPTPSEEGPWLSSCRLSGVSPCRPRLAPASTRLSVFALRQIDEVTRQTGETLSASCNSLVHWSRVPAIFAHPSIHPILRVLTDCIPNKPVPGCCAGVLLVPVLPGCACASPPSTHTLPSATTYPSIRFFALDFFFLFCCSLFTSRPIHNCFPSLPSPSLPPFSPLLSLFPP